MDCNKNLGEKYYFLDQRVTLDRLPTPLLHLSTSLSIFKISEVQLA